MNILIMSDTHGNFGTIKRLMENYKSVVSHAIHLGDHAKDMTRYSRSYDSDIVCHITNGNTDPLVEGYEERVIEIGGKRMFITHGHNYGVKSGLDRLIYKAIELKVDACLFGHTHIPELFTHGGIVFLNPGSTVYPDIDTVRSYGLLRISDEGKITGKLLNYKELVC